MSSKPRNDSFHQPPSTRSASRKWVNPNLNLTSNSAPSLSSSLSISSLNTTPEPALQSSASVSSSSASASRSFAIRSNQWVNQSLPPSATPALTHPTRIRNTQLPRNPSRHVPPKPPKYSVGSRNMTLVNAASSISNSIFTNGGVEGSGLTLPCKESYVVRGNKMIRVGGGDTSVLTAKKNQREKRKKGLVQFCSPVQWGHVRILT